MRDISELRLHTERVEDECFSQFGISIVRSEFAIAQWFPFFLRGERDRNTKVYCFMPIP